MKLGRLRFTTGGAVFVAATLAVGFAAVNTGNNLLYLLLGAMLGATAISGWISEQSLRRIEVVRRVPQGVPVGQETTLRYSIRNLESRLPALALEVHEQGLPGAAFVARIDPGDMAVARSTNTFVRRGVYPLDRLVLSTSFPFGFFRKERHLRVPGELVIWPRTDRVVAPPRPGTGRRPTVGATPGRGFGARGDFHGLRDYRWGDDARDIHWRSSARRAAPVVREYEPDVSDTLWLCLDLGSPAGEAAEEAVELVASLSARASEAGRHHGLVAGATVLFPATGRAHLEQVLEVLARVDFDPNAPTPTPPVDPAECVLVSATPRRGPWADIVVPPLRPPSITA